MTLKNTLLYSNMAASIRKIISIQVLHKLLRRVYIHKENVKSSSYSVYSEKPHINKRTSGIHTAICPTDASKCSTEQPLLNQTVTLNRQGNIIPFLGAGFSVKKNYNTGYKYQPLMLMDFPRIMFPKTIKLLKNIFFNFFIKTYYDQSYSPLEFLEGSKEAVQNVSNLISNGNFEDLENQGLVEREPIQEIKRNYDRLSCVQRNMISINKIDIIANFIYEVGIIFYDHSKRQFVEITTILHGKRGYEGDLPDFQQTLKMINEQSWYDENYFVCNYSFIRELTKGVEADWTITKLNHFLIKDFIHTK